MTVLLQGSVVAGCPAEPVEPQAAARGGEATGDPGTTPAPPSPDAAAATVAPTPEPVGCVADEPSCQRLPQHPDLVARRARLERLQQRLDAVAAGSWP